MRDGWVETTLGDVVELGKGGSWGQDDHAESLIEVVCLRGTDLADLIEKRIPSAPTRWVKESELKKSRCEPDMVLIETSGSKCGRSIVLSQEILNLFHLPVVYSNFCRTLKIATERVSNKFIEIWFSHHYQNGLIPSYRATSAMPNLDVKALLRVEKVLIPPLPEQKRIVDLVSSVDSYIEALRQQLERAKVSRNAVLHELLTAGGDGWTETTLGDAVSVVNGGTPSTKQEQFWGGEITWITTTELTACDGRTVDSSKRTITDDGLKSGATKMVRAGTTLVGTTATIGTCAMAACDLTFNQQISGLIPKNNKVDDVYLFYWIQFSKPILENLSAGTSFRRISTTALKTVSIKYPPLPEQKRIVDLISTAASYIDALEGQINRSMNLRSGLLSDLLGGDHEIPASYDQLIGAP
jgi:type I restriction enzyme S subunit